MQIEENDICEFDEVIFIYNNQLDIIAEEIPGNKKGGGTPDTLTAE